jgi:hypothetical protein
MNDEERKMRLAELLTKIIARQQESTVNETSKETS